VTIEHKNVDPFIAARLLKASEALVKEGRRLLTDLSKPDAKAMVLHGVTIIEEFITAINKAVETDDLETFERLQDQLQESLKRPPRMQ
jgi:hypothetical protein